MRLTIKGEASWLNSTKVDLGLGPALWILWGGCLAIELRPPQSTDHNVGYPIETPLLQCGCLGRHN